MRKLAENQNGKGAEFEGGKAEFEYRDFADPHKYIEQLTNVDPEEARQWLNIGVDVGEENRSGTYIQKDCSIVHSGCKSKDVEVMSISQALETYDWLSSDYMWRLVSPDKDEFTKRAHERPHEGYFIRSYPGAVVKEPVQSCLYISEEGLSQNVHNIVIAEEDSEMHIITGCATAPNLRAGMHVGISEFYVKKNATLHFTMIHQWGERIEVRPRSVIRVEEGGTVVSNYISLSPVGSLQMYPVTYLEGKDSVARFNSILVAPPGCELDVGSKVFLNQPGARAEIISRAITTGGTIIARGEMDGSVEDVKGHLECKGLILKDGIMHAIPELVGRVPGVDMSHEAAVGKIDQKEIEYLMARGLDEETAVSTIVRGFLNVDIEGLPPGLAEEIDRVVGETQHDAI
ncbi:MAG: SufD family Fe-S cluster assembly protein [Desulfobacteraceae bacterium]|nr:SufD family Fe-S cluster assembly protein [Desulfobacteraceae bacterium]